MSLRRRYHSLVGVSPGPLIVGTPRYFFSRFVFVVVFVLHQRCVRGCGTEICFTGERGSIRGTSTVCVCEALFARAPPPGDGESIVVVWTQRVVHLLNAHLVFFMIVHSRDAMPNRPVFVPFGVCFTHLCKAARAGDNPGTLLFCRHFGKCEFRRR